eukprot:CAMPEP_0176428314 /NCGR_PEP_ID=MMETSP0127-20121128/13077_1 /TAXON_ID=938130 /ORGANISM="Platyophrya macrostoma, Strain WH" /LENGTH=333 /DNA_ID=CAMNT_0017809975 /DNA_START=103 /DNA_END=1104 /DNA_ORIENTATION=+
MSSCSSFMSLFQLSLMLELLLALGGVSLCSASATLLSYGSGSGDSSCTADDRVCSTISLPSSPTLYVGGQNVSQFYVSTNGLIEFDSADASYTVGSLTSFNQRLVATYYADLVTTVNQRVVNDSATVASSWTAVASQLPTTNAVKYFTPSALIVATWNGTFFGTTTVIPIFQTIVAWNSQGGTVGVHLFASLDTLSSDTPFNGYCTSSSTCVSTASQIANGIFGFFLNSVARTSTKSATKSQSRSLSTSESISRSRSLSTTNSVSVTPSPPELSTSRTASHSATASLSQTASPTASITSSASQYELRMLIAAWCVIVVAAVLNLLVGPAEETA